jgi:hypothetical protein
MNKKPLNIRLHRETLRALDPKQMKLAAAGANFSLSPCNPNSTPVTKCGDQCATYSCGINKCD